MCLTEQVTKQTLTYMLPNLFIEINVPSDVYVTECKQFGVCIAGDGFFKPTSITFDKDQKENKLFKIVNDYLFYSLQSVPASLFMHQNVNSFILRRSEWFVLPNWTHWQVLNKLELHVSCI